MKSIHFGLVLFLLLLSTGAVGQEMSGALPKKARTTDDYKVRTMKEIATAGSVLLREDAGPEGERFLDGDLFPSRVRATYRGGVRPVGKEKKELIAQWAARYAGNPDHYTQPYTNEVLFRASGVDHWLVVKNATLPELKRQLKKGGSVDLYLVRLGALKKGDNWQWVLLVDMFAKPGK
jgi:hypothetical protein